MKPINIYALTRAPLNTLSRFEKHMSFRQYGLKIKEWEIECLRNVSEHLYAFKSDISDLYFYYSFQIPKLGKEFDLLRIAENYIINIELKSGDVSDEKIKKQLKQNRYYLSMLGISVRSYTYITSQDRLVRLTNGERLIEESFENLLADLERLENVYDGDVEDLFKEEQFLISPLTDPEKFLRREYFLTCQQSDIRAKMIRNINEKGYCVQGFTGLPGTGKTLLLYDLAMQLTWKKKVCVLHFGSFPEELDTLNERLKRIDFYHCSQDLENRGDILPKFDEYAAILIDEGHRISKEDYDRIVDSAKKYNIPVILSYDLETLLSREELQNSVIDYIENTSDYIKYKLTNRIRMNSELSSFIHCLMRKEDGYRRKEYPSVKIAYATKKSEVISILKDLKNQGYIYIRDERLDMDNDDDSCEMSVREATCKEFDQVVMLMDSSFYYDESGYLRAEDDGIYNDSRVRMLYHGLNRAKSGLAVIIYDNEKVFELTLGTFGQGVK